MALESPKWAGDVPTILDSGHQHTIYGLGNLNQGTTVAATTSLASLGALAQQAGIGTAIPDTRGRVWPVALNNQRWADLGNQKLEEAKFESMMKDYQQNLKPPQKENQVTRRLVQVFIADPNENVPLEDSLLYSGEQKLTDSTDQELFFEIDIKSILDAYNKKRITFIDKKVKERTEHLEPVKIRELKMVVVTVAGF